MRRRGTTPAGNDACDDGDDSGDDSGGGGGGGGGGSSTFDGLLLPLLVAVRVFSALRNTITDCDETFNYWEPTHYLLHNHGFQTWEYAPRFALRSFPYLLPHALAAQVVAFFLPAGLGDLASAKVTAFYGVRLMLGGACACAEVAFCRAAAVRFGPNVGRLALALSATSAGMFAASTAFLPASFAMYAVMAVWAAWLAGRHERAVALGVFAVCLGNWPFVGALFVPLMLDTFVKHGLLKPVGWGLKYLALALVPSVAVDAWFYRRVLSSAWNLFAYNVLGGGGGGGAELYGTEPADFYLKNAALNLNLTAALALGPAALYVVVRLLGALCGGGGGASRREALALLAFLSPLYGWFGLMCSRDHKEERFLFPVYPLFALAAAIALDKLQALAAAALRSPRAARGLALAALAAAAALSASRVAAVVTGYGAPLTIYQHVSRLALTPPPAPASMRRLCVGQEWYRFPASFFVASAPVRLQVSFLKSGFGGQLPAEFLPDVGTHSEGGPFNDENAEEPSRYVELNSCDYVVDWNLGGRWDGVAGWEVLARAPFLDAAKSHALLRAFYVPFGVSAKRTAFEDYLLLKNTQRA